jgi:hypothetical protein
LIVKSRRVASVGVARFTAERRHLDAVLAEHHDHHPELLAHQQRAAEQRRDAGGNRVGGDVVIGRLAGHQHVTHAPASQQGGVPGPAERRRDVLSRLAGRPRLVSLWHARHCNRAG